MHIMCAVRYDNHHRRRYSLAPHRMQYSSFESRGALSALTRAHIRSHADGHATPRLGAAAVSPPIMHPIMPRSPKRPRSPPMATVNKAAPRVSSVLHLG